MKELIKYLMPPIVLHLFRKILGAGAGNVFIGGFDDWSEAASNSSGYSDDIIFHKVLEASLSIKDSSDKFERDSIILEGTDYPWTILGPLLWISNKLGGSLLVMDYGGSLGSVYFRSLNVLSSIKSVKWVVIEQEKYCEAGKRHFENHQLSFWNRIDEPLENQRMNIGLFSSSLQYLDNPYEILSTLINSGVKYFIFDRTPFSTQENDKVVVQKVPKEIYSASYPMWIFSRIKFEEFFKNNHGHILTKSIAPEGVNRSSDGVFFSFQNLVIEISNVKKI